MIDPQNGGGVKFVNIAENVDGKVMLNDGSSNVAWPSRPCNVCIFFTWRRTTMKLEGFVMMVRYLRPNVCTTSVVAFHIHIYTYIYIFVIIPVVCSVLVALPQHMMMSSNGNIFLVTGPYGGEFTGHQWILLTKGQSASWINGWVSNRESGDLRRHCAHYDVTVMWLRVFFRISFIADYIRKTLNTQGLFVFLNTRSSVVFSSNKLEHLQNVLIQLWLRSFILWQRSSYITLLLSMNTFECYLCPLAQDISD